MADRLDLGDRTENSSNMQVARLNEELLHGKPDSSLHQTIKASPGDTLPPVEITTQPETSKRRLNDSGEYTVTEGDMLSYIAKDFLGPGASTRDIYNFVSKIARDNNLKDPDHIQPDQRLKINLPPAPDATSPASQKASAEVTDGQANSQPSPKSEALPSNDGFSAPKAPVSETTQNQVVGPQVEADNPVNSKSADVAVAADKIQQPPTEPIKPVEPEHTQTEQTQSEQAQPQQTQPEQTTEGQVEPNLQSNPPLEEEQGTVEANTNDTTTIDTGDTLDKLGHVAGLALEGAKDHIVEHPVLVAAETIGGAIVGGVLVATAPAWLTASVAIGGIGYLGYKLYDKSKELLPALDTVFEDNPNEAEYRQSEQILKEDLGIGLVDGAMIVAGGYGAKMVANKFSSKAATGTAASAEEAEQAIVEEAAKQVPKPQPEKALPGKATQNTDAVKAKATQNDGPDQSTKPTDSKAENPLEKGTPTITQKNSNTASADEWTGTKYKNTDGTFRQEDSHFVSADGRVAVVADGVGGNGAGNVASRITTDVFSARMQQLPENAGDDQVAVWLKQTIEEAAQIMKQAQYSGRYTAPDGSVIATNGKMASTVVATVRNENKMLVAWAGDSRAYRLRSGKLEQVTKDHSWENEMVDNNIMTMEQAQAQDKGHIIVSALGSKLKIDQVTVDIAKGDRFLLASDGLETLSAPEIETIMNTKEATGEVASRLLKRVKAKQALSNEAQDNTTVIVLDPKTAVELPKPVLKPAKPGNPGGKALVIMPGVVPTEEALHQYLEVPALSI